LLFVQSDSLVPVVVVVVVVFVVFVVSHSFPVAVTVVDVAHSHSV